MRLFAGLLTGRTYWKIHRNDPKLLELASLPDWFFVNPLVYPKLPLDLNIWSRPKLVADDVTLVESNGMVIGTMKDRYSFDLIPFPLEKPEIFRADESDTADDVHDVAPAYLGPLATNLRQTSKQVELPTGLAVISGTEVSELPSANFPTVEPNGQKFLARYIWDTAVTWEQLIEADVRLIASKTPIYEELLLDAIHAFYDNDYRRTLLYSAISIETIAATILEDRYEVALHAEDHDHELRIIQRQQAGGSIILKDPVYEFLVARGKFAELLHQLPLYLMGKSLLVENEQLYQKAIQLYKTRNKIAHLGDSSAKGPGGFSTNQDDARITLQVALDIFRWFGNDTKFPISGPGSGMIQGLPGIFE